MSRKGFYSPLKAFVFDGFDQMPLCNIGISVAGRWPLGNCRVAAAANLLAYSAPGGARSRDPKQARYQLRHTPTVFVIITEEAGFVNRKKEWSGAVRPTILY